MSTATQTNTDTTNASTQTFITALVLNAAIGGAEFAAFLILARKFPKIYSSRSKLIPDEEKERRPNDLPTKGFFDLIPAIIKADDRLIISYNGLDAYLFVRFIKLMIWIFAPVALISWAVLLPVYGTSTGGNTQLTQFTFGNIGEDQTERYAAPLILAYLTTFWILFIVHREWKSYIQLRREFLTSKRWRSQPQASTVLVTGLPKDMVNLEALHNVADVYPGGVARIWLARDPGETLTDAYDRRQDAGKKLEKAANKALKNVTKLVKKNKVTPEGNADQEKNGSKLSRFLPEKKMPSHRLGKVPCFGTKVDTINWAHEELQTTNKYLDDARHVSDFENKYEANSSAFIMFNDQVSAHEFAQNLNNNLPKSMKLSARDINAAPEDVIWKNLNVDAKARKVKKIISWAITIVTIIFWAIPVAFVSSISNVNKLCTTVSFLSWLCTLPTPVNGIIQGALPPIAFAVLFMLLPIFLRALSKFEGTPLLSQVELSLQKRYFAFLFIHGFIVSVLAGGFMASASQISEDPSAVATILANNLPTSSVFFLTLIVTSGLAGAAGGILQIARLAIYYIKAMLLGGSPRALYKVRYSLPAVKFGQLYPAQMLITVIALAYVSIAPLVCGFALVTFTLWWFCYKYLFIWVQDQPASMETGGLFFKVALNQMFAGLYITQLSLTGLFFLARNESNGFGALVEAILMVVLLISCIAAQIWLNFSTRKDNVYLPSSMREGLSNKNSFIDGTGMRGGANEDGHGSAAAAQSGEPLAPAASGQTAVDNAQYPNHKGNGQNNAGPEGVLNQKTEDGYDMKHAYLNPVFYRDQPKLWIPRDQFGLSQEQVHKAHANGISMTDEDATLDEKAKVEIHRDTLPGQDFDP